MRTVNPTSSVGLEQFHFAGADSFDMKKFRSIFKLNPSEISTYLKFPRQQVRILMDVECYKPRRGDHIAILREFQKVLTVFLLLLKPDVKRERNKLINIISTWFKAPNPALPDFKSPIDLLAEGKGKIVLDVLNDELHSTYS